MNDEQCGKMLFERLHKNGLLWRQKKGAASWTDLPPNLKIAYMQTGKEILRDMRVQALLMQLGKTTMDKRN